jgi:hypothetical protein
MRRLSAVLLALPLRKDFHPLRGEDARSDERGKSGIAQR